MLLHQLAILVHSLNLIEDYYKKNIYLKKIGGFTFFLGKIYGILAATYE